MSETTIHAVMLGLDAICTFIGRVIVLAAGLIMAVVMIDGIAYDCRLEWREWKKRGRRGRD